MKAIIFDTETTGLPLPKTAPLEKQPRIIELGALVVDKNGPVASLNQLIDPGVEITAEITKITGITQEQLKGQISFKDFLPQLKEFFAGADFLIAHNAPFDKRMLELDLERCECTDFPWPEQTICTVQEFRSEFGKRPKLLELYEHVMGEPLMQTHRALDDVKALYAAIEKNGFLSMLLGESDKWAEAVKEEEEQPDDPVEGED